MRTRIAVLSAALICFWCYATWRTGTWGTAAVGIAAYAWSSRAIYRHPSSRQRGSVLVAVFYAFSIAIGAMLGEELRMARHVVK